ncbi:MAG: L-histidine N(alpha)-methyltransferase [Pseudomonadota bacterium]
MKDSVELPCLSANAVMRDEVLRGLGRAAKTLSSKWLYDCRGSALFEEVTKLPAYYLTRRETAILRDHAKQLAGLVPPGGAFVELGSGASVKTRILLDAGAHFGAYVPVDIAAGFLVETAHTLRHRYPHIPIHPHVGDFTAPIALPSAVDGLRKVGFFPGSTIGNLPPAAAKAVLSNARQWSDVKGFVLGVDLVKPEVELRAAYDDPEGRNAAFIFNALTRLNTELGATFDLSRFSYAARWDAQLAQIETQLISTCAQTVSVAGQMITFAKDEPVTISMSRKFTHETLADLAQISGWSIAENLTDADGGFAVAVLEPGGELGQGASSLLRRAPFLPT